MVDINKEISRLIHYALGAQLMKPVDRAYSINRLLALLKLTQYTEYDIDIEESLSSPEPILENMLDWAAEQGVLLKNTPVYREIMDTEIMNCLMPRPSSIVHKFEHLAQTKGSRAATDYYYALSKASNYIRMDRVAKDLQWTGKTPFGDMIITVNLSKPEKDPADIAAAQHLPSNGYPKCLLCRENEGYYGTVAHPARGNHRIIPVRIDGESWFLQYSPYVYYNEHCIVLNARHVPMKIDESAFRKLLDFVGQFPHYFVGSNADLPIVGGSILTHDHFQGGRFEFPMAVAPMRRNVQFKGFEDIDAGLVNWSMSTIRLSSESSHRLVQLSTKILEHWRAYSDEDCQIRAFTGDTPHNTITPIARMRGGRFELDLVLRNNRTTEEHPMGLFHPHAEHHHIKKENIGLIEVMGLAILPARLKEEMVAMKQALLSGSDEWTQIPSLAAHAEWLSALKAQGGYTEETVEVFLQTAIAQKFSRILEDAGVFKNNPDGWAGFDRFVQSVN